jgi:DNA-binding beta-propeller fold protein YncE
VSYPRISVFAGSANGNASPTRVIEGQNTLQARTSHDISVDAIHDEIATPNPFAQAILFFNGGAKGDEAPIRVIQGPKTMLNYPDNVTIDAPHREAYVAQVMTDAILVFRSDVGGDVAPIRILHGPKTKIDRPVRVSVDPVNNLMAVTTIESVLIFNRADSGDVAPKWIISGPKTGLSVSRGTRKVIFSPLGKKIIATGRTQVPGANDELYSSNRGKPFIGVWKYGDNGDVAPWGIMPDTAAYSMDLDPKAKELITVDRGKLVVYHMPELFE